MALEYAILGFLSREPMTGYDLKTRCFDEAAGHVWTADQSQVYRTLETLAERKLVSARLVPQRGRPDRRIYSITARGRSALSEWLARPERPGRTRDPFLLHLFFAPDLPDEDIADLLKNARDVYQRRLDELRGPAREQLDLWARTTGRSRDAEIRRMTLAAGAAAARSAIDWIDDSLDAVRRGLPAAEAGADSGPGGARA